MESAAPSVAPSARDLVQTVLDTLSIFVMPDWKAIIAFLPFVLALLFIAWFALTLRKFATLGPSRRAVVSEAVIASSGTAGRSRAMRRAVEPELV